MPLEPCALRSNVKRGCDLRIVANVCEQPRQRKETMTLPSCLAFLHLKGKIQNEMLTDTSGCHAILEDLRDECCSEARKCMFTLRNSLRLDQDKYTVNELEMRLLGGV